MADIQAFFENVQLPTIPDVARELIATMKDDDIPFEKVRAAISKDPALTAKLIRLANSARFGLPRQVASLDDAITMVGLNQVRTLALASCMSGVFKDVPGVDADAFWKESMAIAGYSQWLARTLGSNVQESWLAGFLVRLGELIIAQKAPEQIPAIEQLPHHAGGRWERERTLLGFTEAQVTAELARRWRFPDTITRALETAEDPVLPPGRHPACGHLAGRDRVGRAHVPRRHHCQPARRNQEGAAARLPLAGGAPAARSGLCGCLCSLKPSDSKKKGPEGPFFLA